MKIIKKKAKEVKVKEEKYTDIVSEIMVVDGNEMVKKTYLNGDKVVKEVIVSE